jgi:hypothetical protein
VAGPYKNVKVLVKVRSGIVPRFFLWANIGKIPGTLRSTKNGSGKLSGGESFWIWKN